MTEIVCPICGPVQAAVLFEKKKRKFCQCNQCGLKLQWPLPTQEELAQYYDEEFSKGMYKTFTEAQVMKQRTASYRLRKVLRWVKPQGAWLDVGCANGVFVATAAAVGAEARGIELSSVAVQQACEQGLDVRQARIEDVPVTETYDCITAFDVNEHVLDPHDFVRAIADRLNSGAACGIDAARRSFMFARVMGRIGGSISPKNICTTFIPKRSSNWPAR